MPFGFVTCSPSEALVISGVGYDGTPKFVTGGRAFVWPFVHKVQRINLNTFTLVVDSPRVYTKLGVACSVVGIAQVKIEGSREDLLKKACQQFLGKSTGEIQRIALETLEGHQRAIMGTMTVEEIYRDRQTFNHHVFEVATADLVNLGIRVVSYTIKDIHDDEGYLNALGMARTAEVKRDARIGEAIAKKETTIKAALADEARVTAKAQNDIEIAKAQRDFELQKATYDMEVQGQRAVAELAYSLQAAKTHQLIKEQEMEIAVVERTRRIELQEQEIARRQKELEATVLKPAEAERYRVERIAEAQKNRIMLEAEAEAETIRLRGEAEAFAIQAKAKAEAEQMAQKAAAWKEYKEAAMVDMVLKTLPNVCAEVSRPLSQLQGIKMVSAGDGEIGVAKLVGEVVEIVTRMPHLIETMTGVDMAKAVDHKSGSRK
ncbi:flotillin-1-like [Paramacrobiotus metropolitanus]|uniref:flotillin-1-like n=1 Tax=Paramacrobiotus metropolitanus TaxID=2943436 RepID=UPI002445D434|nr:flotillin-1-like [Paramacrobiotus metropolitanus]